MDKERKFLPAGIMISAGILIIGGIALGVIGTPLVALKGNISLSLRTGLELFSTSLLKEDLVALSLKSIISLVMVLSGLGLSACIPEARSVAVGLLAVIGVGMPVFIKISMSKIDFEFIYAFQLATLVICSATMYYLTKPSTIECINNEGYPAWPTSSYCPICEVISHDKNVFDCADCESPMVSLYETEHGHIFALPIEGKSKG